MVKIAPSILSADFSQLKQQVQLVERGGADWLHIDIMDGHFVPNITFGPGLVKTVHTLTKLPLDTHLMISDPDRYLADFAKAGAHRLTVHVETCPHLHRTIQHIKELGVNAGVTLNPSTPASSIIEILPFVDLVLVMTVNPGFGGQKFIASMMTKIQEIAELIRLTKRKIYLEVDGGVDHHNAKQLALAGANVLVAGHAIFSRRNIPQAIKSLRTSATT